LKIYKLGTCSCFLLLCLGGQESKKEFTPKKISAPPPQGYITGKTIDTIVGKELLGPLGVATLCGDKPFQVNDAILYWEPKTGWETGYLYGAQNREVFGRHTYTQTGTYLLSMRIDATCDGGPYHDVVRGESTINVR